MTQLRKAIFFSVLNQYSLQIISIVSVAVLARLLTPDEIGVFSVATAITFLAIELRSFGVGEFLIREKDVNPEKVKAVVGVMVIMSWGLALLLICSAPWVASFYKQPDLRNLLWITIVPFFLAPYSSIPFALLAREMRFAAILKINLIGALARNGCSIGLVLMGYSYFGLAYGALLGVLVEFFAIMYFRPASMQWIPSFKHVKEIFHIGMQISFSKLFNSTSQHIGDLVLGRVASMGDVGLFSRGLGLISFLNSLLGSAVAPVTFPHLSEVQRAGGDTKTAYLNAAVLIGAISLPFFAVVNISSESMIRALFGDQWTISAHVASVLALWAMLQSIHCFAAGAMVAVGKERLLVIKEGIAFVLKIALIVLMAPHGLIYVAWGFVISGVIDFGFTTWFMRLSYGISLRDLIEAFIPNFIVMSICWIVAELAHVFIDFHAMNAWLAVLIIACLLVPTWLVSLRISNNMLWPYVCTMIKKVTSFRLGSQPG
jgi:O-antigen/teichoic acid export membrane protein